MKLFSMILQLLIAMGLWVCMASLQSKNALIICSVSFTAYVHIHVLIYYTCQFIDIDLFSFELFLSYNLSIQLLVLLKVFTFEEILSKLE